MASASNLPIIGPEDSPASAIMQLESAAAEENKMLRLRILKMWDAWSNSKEPPSVIPEFPELILRSGEVTKAPVPNPLISCGHPPMTSNDPDMLSVVRPQASVSWAPPILFSTAPVSWAPPILFSIAPVCTRTQPTLPRPYVEPPVFTFQGPQLQSKITYVTPYSLTQPPQYDLSVEQEKVVKNPEQKEMARKMKSLEQSMKNMQGLSGQKSVSYSDLYIFPHVHLSVGFKMPKVVKYNGHGNPVAHLKRCCNQLRGIGGKEELLMAYFRERLTEIASEWYTDQEITHWHMWDDMTRDFVRQF
ncbi:uncharacterized protein LOC107790637 [Nicotiana tabacum]|uniref:Uncharacterized protein LOC107790637 n=1 Tax=Nicotiana tabacum TaxID=4097 RepID=A0AC58UN46_TOBAC